MANIKQTENLDEILTDYGRTSQVFDAMVLKTFINKYPEYSRELQRYAHIQLTSVPASQDEINSEPLSDEEMLPLQSKLLQRMQQLRGIPSASDISEAADKLASISGERAMQAAVIKVFGGCGHGEDLLFLCVTESSSEVRGVPDWLYKELSIHLGVTPAALIASMAMKRQKAIGMQRFSAKGKPAEPPPMTWEQALNECITDDGVKKAIMQRS